MNWASLNQPRVIWGALGALALILALEWLWPAPSPAILPPPRPRVINHADAPALAERDTSGWGDTVLARPLFSVSRRPPRILKSTSSSTAVGQARLSGIMITRYGKHAIFAPDGGGKQLVLGEGAAVNESTIRRILPDGVVLASGAVLRPSFDRNRLPGITPPFQPVQPGFPNPNFPNPGFPNPKFPNPGFPNPMLQAPGIPAAGQPAADDGSSPVQPAQPFVRPMPPPRREP